jgi:hypothetical protein
MNSCSLSAAFISLNFDLPGLPSSVQALAQDEIGIPHFDNGNFLQFHVYATSICERILIAIQTLYAVSRTPISIFTFTEPNRMNPDARFSSSNLLSFCLNRLFQSRHPSLTNLEKHRFVKTV